MAVWFTADTHFGHANIIRYCKRPFASAAEMDEVLLRHINERVGVEDVLYHLGDFLFAAATQQSIASGSGAIGSFS